MNLAHEFRLKTQHSKAIKWLADVNGTSLASLGVLTEFGNSRGEQKPSLKLDYNSLTNLSHPTESAAMNSFAAALRRLKSDGAEAMTKEAEEKDQLRIPYALQRLIWLVIDQDSRFITIPIADADIPHSIEFFEAR